jgi:hypothetical protein
MKKLKKLTLEQVANVMGGKFLNEPKNKKVLEKIIKEFDFNFKYNYWFDENGKQILSTIGILIDMYNYASWIYFDRNNKKKNKFMRRYMFDIIHFAENTINCGWDYKNYEEISIRMANIIYQDICKKQRKWWITSWLFLVKLKNRHKL